MNSDVKVEFENWNARKQSLEKELASRSLFPKESEVWMCSWGRNIGFEQNGIGDTFRRPALVIKKFNNQMFWAVPLSTKQKDLDFYFNFVDPKGNKVSGIIAQLRLISVKRFGRKLYNLESDSLIAIKLNMVRQLFGDKIETPR